MAQTRAMAAGRATVPAVKMSKPVGITKKKVAAARKPSTSTNTNTSTTKPAAAAVRKGSKRKAAEIDDGAAAAAVPAPKRAKASRAERFAPKPTNHRYGTRSNLSAAVPLLAAIPAVPIIAVPALPFAPLPLPFVFVPSALTPTDPVATTSFSGAPLSLLVVERGGPLSPRELSVEKKARTLGGFRFLGKQKLLKNGKLAVRKHVEAGYQPAKYHAVLMDTEPEIIEARLGEKEEKAYWDKDREETETTARRVAEREHDYVKKTGFLKKNSPNYQLDTRTRKKKWSWVWKRYLIASRKLELTERLWRGKKWEQHRVHESSPLRKDCGAALEEEQRLMDVHAERVAARERFLAAVAAGEIEDAEQYGADYDPFEEDY